MGERSYIAIDLKSFYASVECAELGVDPMTTNLVVADASRTEKTICLAVSPSLKAYGIPGRPRLFEVVERVREINAERRRRAPGGVLTGSSSDARELKRNPSLALDYLVAPPQMGKYVTCSLGIYNIYLRYIAPEDIQAYSIDEVFIDATPYLSTYKMTPRQLAMRMIRDVLDEIGITATVGIGTNLYLAKIAMDIVAKHMPPDADGVRIAELDEQSYRRTLWTHWPLTDFWRIGPGTARRLASRGMYTMGDIARCSLGGARDLHNEDLLYQLFGVGAELLIDHAWGWEPCGMADIKAYRPETSSISSGQVLSGPTDYETAKLIVREMTDLLSYDLIDRGAVTDQITLYIGYDVENLNDPTRRAAYRGAVTTDHYGRSVPKSAHGMKNLSEPTASAKRLLEAMTELYERIADQTLLIRRINLSAGHLVSELQAEAERPCEQLDLFADPSEHEAERQTLEREKRMQKAILGIRKRYGKNAILKGMNLLDGATAIERNGQIGGHKA